MGAPLVTLNQSDLPGVIREALRVALREHGGDLLDVGRAGSDDRFERGLAAVGNDIARSLTVGAIDVPRRANAAGINLAVQEARSRIRYGSVDPRAQAFVDFADLVAEYLALDDAQVGSLNSPNAGELVARRIDLRRAVQP